MIKPYIKQLQTLYDHEIHFGINVQWDAGFHWHLGYDTELNCTAEGSTKTAAEAVEQLWSAALEHVPEETRISLLTKVMELQ